MISDTILLICRVFSGSQKEKSIICYDLPEDVLIEILLRLPVKSLLRFEVVCKAWKSHISNPQFVKRHNVMTTTNPNNDYIIAQNDTSLSHQKLCAIDINSMHRAVSLTTSRRQTEKLYLWNLATRKVKELPGTALKISSKKLYDASVLGFCFDFASSDYKVVRIVRTSNNSSVNNRVEVYSLIKNSWKEIEVKLNFGELIEFYSLAFVKGSLYWSIKAQTLILFNVQSEDFCTIPVPPNAFCFDLFEFKGSVALIDEVVGRGIINIWTLDDHSCWIKKLAIFTESIHEPLKLLLIFSLGFCITLDSVT
ncbi:hypothetical protein POM88_019663 [Heracleum sosnowskyi]|uniref:F-box domain-containing protein n=1 Tax=Heracleum sosnowskyi TaxID=360622 RepID=A0AAD8ICL1_9APIA|nr:hypothetical protein POM88_019663 [Heracleum sosnowskyi]